MIKNAVGFVNSLYGDTVIMTVACRAFKLKYPDAKLTFAVADKFKDILPLFVRNPNIDSFHVWSSYNDWPQKVDQEYINFRKFDYVFHPQPAHSRLDWYNHNHYAQEACIRYGLVPPDDLSYELVKWFPELPEYKKCITLSLFPNKGTQMDKTMTVEECENLCVGIKKLGYQPIQLGGKYEVKLENAVSPDLSFIEAAQILTSSALHITADTAFSSIAAGYKHKTLGFYGLNYKDMRDCGSHLPPNSNAYYFRNIVPQQLKAEELLTAIPTIL